MPGAAFSGIALNWDSNENVEFSGPIAAWVS